MHTNNEIMKAPHFIILTFVGFFLFIPPVSGERAVFLSNTYDFDGDGLSEFVTVEITDPEAPYPQVAAYYEIDESGFHTSLWHFSSSLPLKDLGVGDIDGNGAPDIVVLTVGPDQFTLRWFAWAQGSFSESPKLEWSGGPRLANRKPFSMTIIDMDNDLTEEIALSMGSPTREIVLLDIAVLDDRHEFEISRTFTSPTVSSGYGEIHLSVLDYNQDGFADLMSVSRELASLKIQIFTNESGDLVEGPSYEMDIGQLSPEFTGLVTPAVTTVDIDQDGLDEVFLPLKTGSAIAINTQPGQIDVSPVEMEVASLFALPREGVEDEVINEILLERAESGITGMKARKLKLEAMETEPAETTEVAVAPTPRKVRKLELTSVDTLTPGEAPEEVSEAEPPPAEEVSPETPPSPPRKVRKLELTAVETATIPPDVEIGDTLFVGDQYTHPLESEEGGRLHAFRPSFLPQGAFFDPSSRSVIWTPSDNQVGIHRLAYEVEYELAGERVEVEEVEGATVRVLSTTVTDTVELYLLVQTETEL